MIVDTDADVHAAATAALAGLHVQQRPFEFVHAYSAGAARALLAREAEPAVILLAVAMDEADEGLHLVRHIREALGLADVRLVLRAGQPGYAPGIDAVRTYDISNYYTRSELTASRLFTMVAAAIRTYELLTHLQTAAFHDQLTGLPNRARLTEILDAILASPERRAATLALVDLDHFAMTNDALGHQFGDLLLVAVAARLQARLCPRLAVARIGSDTFGVLGDGNEVDPAALLELFHAPFQIEGQDVLISATVGLVRLSEHAGHGADALKDADIALKRAKSQQRSAYFYFSRSMGVETRERVRMMHALRSGYRNGELYLVYQPQVDLATRVPIGAEALLRWRTEDGQLVTPDRFIPLAEYSGLIIEIGEWVLRHACEELVRLRLAGYRAFTMSVNVSQVQFRHPRFLDILQRTLAETGAPHGCLELEMTESMAMEEPELLIELLIELKRVGVSVAIDDFGTGFSSLSHLQRLQVDRLKIDRAFVTEITGSARGSRIAEMVIQLGHNLGLSLVAEGVEEERQVEILQALGCPLAQGYLFARPMPSSALLEWLGKADPVSRPLPIPWASRGYTP